jgi:polyketide cyclase/dehydrase/lipid transport protein
VERHADRVVTAGSQGFPGPLPRGKRGAIVAGPHLPIEGSVELAMRIDQLWQAFMDVERWPSWNRCIWRARVRDGELMEGATLAWVFNAIRPWYPYKLPARAEIVEFERNDRVTWEANAPGFHALHSYRFADLDGERCRFGSWEVAEGPMYSAMRRFWLAHFRYVCRSSLAGAQKLAENPSP